MFGEACELREDEKKPLRQSAEGKVCGKGREGGEKQESVAVG
jgi:hypothetical protein